MPNACLKEVLKNIDAITFRISEKFKIDVCISDLCMQVLHLAKADGEERRL